MGIFFGALLRGVWVQGHNQALNGSFLPYELWFLRLLLVYYSKHTKNKPLNGICINPGRPNRQRR